VRARSRERVGGTRRLRGEKSRGIAKTTRRSREDVKYRTSYTVVFCVLLAVWSQYNPLISFTLGMTNGVASFVRSLRRSPIAPPGL
jgi:hypothetical protein